MTRIVQIIADCFICGHPIFLSHLRSIFNLNSLLEMMNLVEIDKEALGKGIRFSFLQAFGLFAKSPKN